VFAAPPVPASELVATLKELGYDFFTGVPCSLVSGLIAELSAETGSEMPYFPETREDAAVGLAAGAWMAGKQPVIVLQNSGLGVCLNALTSMALMYRTPSLLLITWRGYEGKDAPEHIVMGAVSGKLLETIGIPYRVPDPESLAGDLAWATEQQKSTMLPAALLLRAGLTE
jgi:phosphonopyruvate decarboxylase